MQHIKIISYSPASPESESFGQSSSSSLENSGPSVSYSSTSSPENNGPSTSYSPTSPEPESYSQSSNYSPTSPRTEIYTISSRSSSPISPSEYDVDDYPSVNSPLEYEQMNSPPEFEQNGQSWTQYVDELVAEMHPQPLDLSLPKLESSGNDYHVHKPAIKYIGATDLRTNEKKVEERKNKYEEQKKKDG
jgi:hypothetical protein